MTTYCTIEEAYKVPSFDTPARKKKMSPACPSGPGLSSSAGTVANQPYPGERAAVPPPAQPPAKNPYGLLEYNEGFANMQQQTSTSYAGAVQDYDYMCRAYNICGPAVSAPQGPLITSRPPPVVQAFQAPPTMPGSQYLQQYFAYTGTAPASVHQAPAATEGFTNPFQRSCPENQAPQAYTVPVSPEARAQAAVAQATSLAQAQGPSAPPATGPIQGIYDEDLEKYLSTQDPASKTGAPATYIPYSPGYATTTPLNVQTVLNAPKQPGPPTPPATLSTGTLPPVAQTRNQDASKNPAPAPAPMDTSIFAQPKTSPYPVSETTPAPPAPSLQQVGWDLLLFVLAGILIIFLLEQLFKVAMMTGMKRTMEMLGPYLRELE